MQIIESIRHKLKEEGVFEKVVLQTLFLINNGKRTITGGLTIRW